MESCFFLLPSRRAKRYVCLLYILHVEALLRSLGPTHYGPGMSTSKCRVHVSARPPPRPYDVSPQMSRTISIELKIISPRTPFAVGRAQVRAPEIFNFFNHTPTAFSFVYRKTVLNVFNTTDHYWANVFTTIHDVVRIKHGR